MELTRRNRCGRTVDRLSRVAGVQVDLAAEGLFAVVTTIVGAAVGANLTLLLLDIYRDRPAEEPVTAPQAILTPT